MAHFEAVSACQDLGNAPAVAHPPIGLVAQQAARRRFGDLSSLTQVELGLGAGKLLVDDAPEPLPFAAAVRQTALRRRPERREMNITHPGILDRCCELALREAGPARDRPVAHVE